MFRFISGILAVFLTVTPALAEDSIPNKRLIFLRNLDFYGSDLQPLFDTTLKACEKLCLDNPECRGFTFNQNKNACFPKSAVSRGEPFEGALSARVADTSTHIQALAQKRRADLTFLSERDFQEAFREATRLGQRHGGGQWTAQELLDTASGAHSNLNFANAIHWTGAALAQSDDPRHWLQYAQWSADYAKTLKGSERQKYRNRSRLAAINTYLRSTRDGERVTALYLLARALEYDGRGRQMIPALRLAESLQPRPEVVSLLDKAIGKYGFRIVEHQAESDSADPRLCVNFSEPLLRGGADYSPYVRLPDPKLAVQAEDQRICISGVQHGQRYTVTFRAGLPSQAGDTLIKDVPITAYMRDRTPSVSFPGRTYVLPRSADAGLPVETVNTDTLDLTLRRLSDRNLVRGLQDRYVGLPLGRYDAEFFDQSMGEVIWTGTGQVERQLNTAMTTRLPMGEALGDLAPGIYALTAAVPKGRDDNKSRATQWFVLSDIGLTTLQGNDGLTVFTRALSSAEAMEGLEISLVARSNRVLATALTDAQGMARFEPGLLRGQDSAAPALIVAKQADEDLAFLSLTDPAFDLSDRGVAGRAPAGPMDAFLATDRGAYRAGETIHATALLRDGKAHSIRNVPLTAVLWRADGVEYSRHISDGGKAGGHVFDLPIDASAPRGTWRLELFADPKAQPLAQTTLLVEDFLPERIDFDMALPDAPINPLSPPALDLNARYLFGAPGADLAIEGDLRLSTTSTVPNLPGYRFGRHSDAPSTRYYSFDSARTDAAGRATLPLPLRDITAQGRPMKAEITLRLSELSGRPVERRLERPVASTSAMIGIKPGFESNLPEGATAQFDLLALAPDLSPTPMQVTWQVNRVRTRYQWYQQYGQWNWEPITTRETVARGEAMLGQSPTQVSAQVDWGQYEIVVTRKDGSYLAASMGFEAGWYAPANAADTPDMLELSLDKPAYAPGDTARLRMVPRYAGKALVTVLADRVISMQAIDVTQGETLVDLPVTDDWGAGVYVTAQVIRPMDVQAGQPPARALGLTHASIDPGDKALSVSLDTPAEIAPRGRLMTTLQLDNFAGQETYVTLAAVDLGILNLTGFQSPNPSDHYFGQRRLGVDIRDIYGRLINGLDGAMGTIRSGGDGGAFMRMQSPPPTEQLVAFFSGPVQVDASGSAEIGFDIPDFNGTVRLMAMAWSDRAVGQAQADVLVRNPVVIAASLPRFLAPGDHSRMVVELTHAKGATGAMPLEIAAEGITLDQSALPALITLGEGEKQVLTLPLTANDIGDHDITVTLTTPDGQTLTKNLKLGVRSNDPLIGDTRRLSLAPGQTFTLDDNVFAGLRPQQASALISAGPLARFDAPGLLSQLDRYPYGCTEQVTSQALPLLYLSALTEPLGLGNKARTDLRINQSITKVLARQADNGSFGLWNAYSGDTWISAYVTDFLSRARAAGYSVPEHAFAAALDNLRNRISYAADFDQGGEAIAYALMVLAREGQAAMGDLRYYADEKGDAFGSALAKAQLGAALASYGDQPRADAMFARAQAHLNRSTNSARVYRADYGSNLRDSAGLLSLAVESRSASVDLNALARRLGSADRSLSTQEQSWALLAAHALVQDPTVAGLSFNNTPVTGPFVRKLSGSLNGQSLTNTGTQPTDITLTTLGQPQGTQEAGGYGYRLSREYFTLEGEPVGTTIAQGTRLVTVLTVYPAQDTRARLMINDALPAGFEIDNPSLLRSGDIRALNWLTPHTTEHTEFRSDRFLAAVNQNGNKPIQLAYILRAVSPGEFHHPAALVEDMYRPDYRATTASGRVTITP
ncbi:MAG: alpha-2-macroglobulin family protein [Pelagimonas sp.]|nr:alpha-2-macroglobulin family protein [Pelagimonas sp.]